MINLLIISSGVLYRPLKTITEIYEKFREKILKYGFLVSLIANVSLILALKVIGNGVPINSVNFLFTHIIFALLSTYLLVIIMLSLYTFILGLYKQQVNIPELAGMYLISDLPFLLSLPFALIIKALPAEMTILFYIVNFVLFAISIAMKVKSISLTTNIDTGKSVALIFLPIALVVFFGAINIIYLVVLLTNIFG